MTADQIILQEFRENVEAICNGRDPLNNPHELRRYKRLFNAKTCTIADCDRPVQARGLCYRHYMRMMRGRY